MLKTQNQFRIEPDDVSALVIRWRCEIDFKETGIEGNKRLININFNN